MVLGLEGRFDNCADPAASSLPSSRPYTVHETKIADPLPAISRSLSLFIFIFIHTSDLILQYMKPLSELSP